MDSPEEVVGTLNGRTALQIALNHLNIRGGRALLPAFTCTSVAPIFRKASMQVSFYDVDESGTPVLDQIYKQLGSENHAVVMILHYCGFPNQVLEEVSDIAASTGTVLLEDCAHSALSFDGPRPLGSTGSAGIFSLRKSFPVPDGGSLVINSTNKPIPDPDSGPGLASTTLGMMYLMAGSVESRLRLSPRTMLLRYRPIREKLQASIAERARSDKSSTPIGMSSVSKAILKRQTPENIVRIRRENYVYMLSLLRNLPGIEPMYSELPDGVSPFGFPMICERRDELREHLLHRGINVRAYWDDISSGDFPVRYPGAWQLSQSVLVLPIHQEVNHDDLDYIASVLKIYLR